MAALAASAQGQSRAPGAESGAESLLPLTLLLPDRRPDRSIGRRLQGANTRDVLADLPILGLGRPAPLNRIAEKSHLSRILILCVYRESV